MERSRKWLDPNLINRLVDSWELERAMGIEPTGEI
jgi:hypothetical protein